jgi:hypothetical protein
MVFLLALLFLSFILISGEYGWKGAVLFTVFTGFIQDPIRKGANVDSSYFAAISLFFFILTFFILISRFKGWDLELICWPNPIVVSLLPAFFYLLLLQGLNSFARFGDIRLTTVGILFYIVPLISLWVGYRIGSDLGFVKKVLTFYVILCALTAFSILLSIYGFDNNLLKEVGTGIEITGTGRGFPGLWRTSEIAGWHLAAGASFSFILGMTESKRLKQSGYFLISCALGFLTITTGRRKALGLVLIFLAMYVLYYALSVKSNKFTKALGSLVCVLAISLTSYGLVFSSDVQSTLEPFFDRSSTLTVEESQDRLRVQGIGAILRGLEVAGPLGFGVGVGSNTGTTDIGTGRANIQSVSYVSEGGGGRLIIELGGIGIAFFIFLLSQVLILYLRIFFLSRQLTAIGSDILSGLALFTLANAFTFLSASQLYSDPFVLIVLGLASGAILAIPKIFLNFQTNTVKSLSKRS